MKILKILGLTVLLAMSVSCGSSREETFLTDFLQKKSELSKYQDQITYLGDGICLDSHEEKGREEFEKLLLEIKNMLTERTFQRLIANRELVGEEFIRKEANDLKIEHLSVQKLSDENVFLVQYSENIYMDGIRIKEEKKKEEYTLEIDGKDYKISDIVPAAD